MVYHKIIYYQMKLYINHPIRYHNFNDLSFLDDINEYICSKDFTNYFYSINGIYKTENDSLYKIQIYDNNDSQDKQHIKKIDDYINNYPLYVDNTAMKTINDESYCLPVQHIKKTIQKNVYSLAKNSMIRFVVEIDIETNKLKDHYFITKENPNIEWVKEDIITFLSLIK